MPSLVVDVTENNLTYGIVGAGMTVHNKVGPGFKEEVYEKSLEVELANRGITVIRQYPVHVEYGGEIVAQFFLDLFVEDQVVVEVKALSHLLTNDERAQVFNYLKATGAPVGLLFNFGRRSLEYKRIFPSQQTGSSVKRTGRDNLLKKG